MNRAILLAGLSLVALSCQSNSPKPRETHFRSHTVATTQPAADDDDADLDDSAPALFRRLDETFGRKGEVKDDVYRLITPRTDLLVTMDGMEVPAGAFLESDFRFWRCPCGKLLVNGQFVVADYEANDVINELQAGQIEIASLSPLLLHENPRLMLIRFQAEGRPKSLATALKSALGYTAEARHAAQHIDLRDPLN